MLKWRKRAMGCLLSAAVMVASTSTVFAASESTTLAGARCTVNVSYTYSSATTTTTCSDPENTLIEANVTAYYYNQDGKPATNSASNQDTRGALEVTAQVNQYTQQVYGALGHGRVINGGQTWKSSVLQVGTINL